MSKILLLTYAKTNHMKAALSIIFLFIASVSICQKDSVFIRYNKGKYGGAISYKTDTILFNSSIDRNVLHGTMALPGSQGIEDAKISGLWFYAMTSTDCQKSGGEEKITRNEITDITQTDSTLEIETKTSSNCCFSFLGDINMEGDSILNLKYYGYGSYCSCDCCFGLTYKMNVVPDNEYLRKIKWVEFMDDKKTIKPIQWHKKRGK